jgi:hypothetical protein
MWKGMAPKFGGVFDWQEVALSKKKIPTQKCGKKRFIR